MVVVLRAKSWMKSPFVHLIEIGIVFRSKEGSMRQRFFAVAAILIFGGLVVGAQAQQSPPTQSSAGWAGTIKVHWDISHGYKGSCDVMLTLYEDGSVEGKVEGTSTYSSAGETDKRITSGAKILPPTNGVSLIQVNVTGLRAPFRYSIFYSAGSFLVPTTFTRNVTIPGGTRTSTTSSLSTCVISQPPISSQQSDDPNHLSDKYNQTTTWNDGRDTGTVWWDLQRSPKLDFYLGIYIQGVDQFRAAIEEDLKIIATCPVGADLLNAIKAQGKYVYIKYSDADPKTEPEGQIRNLGSPPTPITIEINPNMFPLNASNTPRHVALAHELIHAYHYQLGLDHFRFEPSPDKKFASLEEYNTIANPELPLTENKYRSCFGLKERGCSDRNCF
jgi:hypothetical protein